MSSDSADCSVDDGGAENKENGCSVSLSVSASDKHTRNSGNAKRISSSSSDDALSSEITFLQQELSAIVEKHSMDKIASRKMERRYQEQIRTLAEELNDLKGRLEAKDGTLRVLEKQIRGKNEFIDELRGRIEDLAR